MGTFVRELDLYVTDSASVRRWRGATMIDVGTINGGRAPHVALASDGSALVVWSQLHGASMHIWSSTCPAGGTWTAPELVEKHDQSNASAPRVAMDTRGNAVVVWEQLIGARFVVWANRYIAGKGWDPAPVRLQTNSLVSAFSPRVAVDPGGHALAVWQQLENQRYSVWANRFVAGRGWSIAPELIEQHEGTSALRPQVAVDARGDAIVVWERAHDSRSRTIWCKRYTAGYGWGRAEALQANVSAVAQLPQVTMDASGDALVLWQQSDGVGRFSMWSNRYEQGSGWRVAAPADIEAGSACPPQVAADAAGNVVAVWSQLDCPPATVWSSRFSVGSGWCASEKIGLHEATAACIPQVAVASNGAALAVWERRTPERTEIWSNRFE